MSRLLVDDVEREIHDIGAYLIETGFIDDQNFPTRRDKSNGVVVLEADYWRNRPRMAERVGYSEKYERLAQEREFDFRLLDGGLVQVQYMFDRGRTLTGARLAYLPSPDLTPFQTDPELYLYDELYGDVVDIRAVTVPVRFDFDPRGDVVVDLDHPHSHLTLGQYSQCRIPVVSPLSPYYFFEFLLRAFYRTHDRSVAKDLPGPRVQLPRTITRLETSVLHLAAPCQG